MIDLAEIDLSTVDDRTKGMPGGLSSIALGQIGSQGWNVLREDLPLPLAVLRREVLAHNGDWMRRFLSLSGAVIAPHGKTTMSPHLFKQQVGDGAWAITLATAHQVAVARRYGFDRIVLANQLVGTQAIRYVLSEIERDPDFDFYCFVDSVALVEKLAAEAGRAKLSRPLQVLAEGGFAGGRTGARTFEDAMAVAKAVKAAEPWLALRGVGGYEGLLETGKNEETDRRVTAFLDYLVDIALECARLDLFAKGPVLLTAGGSSFYDLVVKRFSESGLERQAMVVTRSGCYLTHDSGTYVERFAAIRGRMPSVDDLGEGPQAALEVWAYVQSRPEPKKAILTVGKRDISFDSRLPKPLKWVRPGPGATARDIASIPDGHVVTGLNDQHCHLAIPETSPLAVGDMVAFGISHPCTTFDKWQVICVVDENYDVVSAVRTFF